MRNRILASALVFMFGIGVVAAFTPLEAQPVQREARAHRVHAFGIGGRLAEALDLSESQQEEWKAIHEAFRDAIQPKMEEIRDLGEELKAALDGDDPDAETVGSLTISIRQLRDESKAAHEVLREDLAEVLTEEQKVRFEELQARREQRRERRRMRRGPRGLSGPAGGGVGGFGAFGAGSFGELQG